MPILRGRSEFVAPLADQQAQTATRAQLHAAGLSESFIDAQLHARRWQAWGPLVIVMHNGPLTRVQLLWAAILHVGPRGCLAARTALEPHGFRGFDDNRVHVVHPRATSVVEMPDLVVHESRRLVPSDITQRRGLRTMEGARAAIDLAAWQPSPRFACAVLAAVVQQRISTGRLLSATLVTVGRVRHARHMRMAVQDIVQGSQTLGELDLVRYCQRHRIEPPNRQRIRRDSRGRKRYLDAEWDCSDGSVVVLEVDGLHHVDAENWVEDMRRERAFVRPGRRVLRCANVEIRLPRPAD